MNDNALPVKVTYARTGMLEADLANKQILMHLYQARYQTRDEKDPLDLRKIRDGINMEEGTLPISLDELYEKEKKRPSRSALSIEQLLEQLKSENQRERSAISSLSAESRPNTSKIAVSNPHGIVKMSENGNT